MTNPNVSLLSFKGTGGTTSRTLGDRAAEVYNVKDFGALGLNTGDDGPAIQAAITAALVVQQASGNTNGAVVFFPPGDYPIGASLKCPNPGWESSITLRGSGQTATTIIGTITGYLINKPDDGGVTIKSIEDMAFLNHSTSPYSGGIRLDRASNVSLSRLQVGAANGLHIGGSDSGIENLSGITNASPGVFSCTGHKQRVGQAVYFFNDRRIFTCSAANATAGATYTNNGRTFTVDSTITGGTTLNTTGILPAASGTLTKSGGTGDATITFSSSRSGLPAPLVEGNEATAPYYIISAGITANAFEVSASVDGTAINTTTANYGTSQMYPRNNVFCVKVDQCVITSNQAAGTAGCYGAMVGQVEFFGCTIVAWDIGIVHSNVGLIVLGSRLETNNTGIRLGDNVGNKTSSPSHNAIIQGNSFERVDVQLDCFNGGGAIIGGNAFTGNTNVAGSGSPVTAVLITTFAQSHFAANGASGTFSNAAYDLSGADSNNMVFDANTPNITGTAWKMPANNMRVNFTFNGNDNIANSITFVGLPGQGAQHLTTAIQGMTYYITDGNQAMVGGNVTAGGGANISSVTYDGTNWKRGV